MNSDRNLEFGVGVFVVLGLAALTYLTLKLGAGTLIGRVDAIRLDSADYSAIVEMRLRSGVQLPADTMASIKTSGLIGDKYIALAPGADEELLKPSSRITMTESALELESLISKMAFGSVNEGPGEEAPNEAAP